MQHAQRFLSVHAQVSNHFRPGRHLLLQLSDTDDKKIRIVVCYHGRAQLGGDRFVKNWRSMRCECEPAQAACFAEWSSNLTMPVYGLYVLVARHWAQQ